jgi:hypothetical protein
LVHKFSIRSSLKIEIFMHVNQQPWRSRRAKSPPAFNARRGRTKFPCPLLSKKQLFWGQRDILFFSMETSKSWDPGRGPNHSGGGGGWRERNGFSKLYFHYHFVIIVSSKESFIVGWWRHGEKDYHFLSTI